MGFLTQNTLLNGDARFVKNIVILLTSVIIWMDDSNAATTEINADVRTNSQFLDIKQDTVFIPNYPKELNSFDFEVSDEKTKLYSPRFLSDAETINSHKSVKSAVQEEEHLTLLLPQFKQILKNAIVSQYRKGPDGPVVIPNDDGDKSTQAGETTKAENSVPYSDEIKDTKVDSDLNETAENDVITPVPAELNPMKIDTETANTFKKLFPLRVSVIVSKPKGCNRNSVITVPLEADMTVMKTLISATRTYMNTHSDHEKNPFDLRIGYDKKLDCFVTINAIGIESRRRQAWTFTVKDMDDKVVYRGQCVPGKQVILRPSSTLRLTYKRIRSRKFT